MASFKNNKTCLVCGKKYTYCTHCAEFEYLPTWMAMFHDENCKNVFNIACDLENGNISDSEAKRMFDECDLSNKNKFNKSIKKSIEKAEKAIDDLGLLLN